MKYLSIIGWGITIYAVMYLAWSGLVLYGMTAGILPRLLALAVLIGTATIAGRALSYHSWKDILPHSFAWAIIVMLLDAVFTVPYTGWQLYSDWNVWVGYALVCFVPLIAPYTKTKPHFDVN